MGSGAAGPLLVSPRQHTDVGDHPAVGSAGCSVTVELPAVVGGTPGGCGHLNQACLPGLRDQDRAEIDMPWSKPVGTSSTPRHHLRAHFIALAANSDATMH